MTLALLDRKFQKVNDVLVVLSGTTLICMACMITFDVIVRYVFNSPLPASVEITMLMEPYVVFLPFAYTLAKGGHVKVTVVTMLLPTWIKNILDMLSSVLDLIFFGLLCYFSWLEFYESYACGEIMLAAIRLPWWSGKFAMPLGMFFICLQVILHLAISARQLGRPQAKDGDSYGIAQEKR
ncbi:MAG: TRAP transporter small permease [Proteobacteria bacterium]|nr:TRAP transporter small permease [Pseudomonadota bacterium]MBU1060500.1 TRAP transporter small permease [Pseudomonadota bacterium]